MISRTEKTDVDKVAKLRDMYLKKTFSKVSSKLGILEEECETDTIKDKNASLQEHSKDTTTHSSVKDN